MMKNIYILITVFVTIFACDNQCNYVKVKNHNIPIYNTEYPELLIKNNDISVLFDNKYKFDKCIVLNYIAIQKIGFQNFKIIFGFTENSNIINFNNLKVASIFYAQEPKKFKQVEDQISGSKKIASVCKDNYYIYNGKPAIAYNFEMIPNNFKYAKFYFYDNNGVINNKIITIRRIKFPK